jgi:phage repressor protein C with HTH and peptisase S24 domain
VIYLTTKDNGPVPVLVRQLVRQVGGKLRVRQHNPAKESDIDLKTVASMYRVLTWDDVVR